MAVLNTFPAQGSTVLWLAVTLLLSYISLSCFLNYRKCSHIPGPWLASISGAWLFNTTLKGRLYLDCAQQLEKYGSFARIAPNKIVTNDPELWRSMAAPRSTFTRGSWYDSMTVDPRFKNSLSERDDKLHNKLRAKMIRGYSGKDIPNLESQIDQSVNDLIQLVRRSAANQKSLDVARLSQFFTLDVLTHIAFGFPFGYLTQNKDVYQYVQKMSEFLGILELCSNFPKINSFITGKLMSPFQPKVSDKTGMGAMLGVAKKVADDRFKPDAQVQNNMMDSFVRNGMTQQEVESESMLQILGGSDSTATAIRMIFLYIVTNPAVYARLIAELDNADSQGLLSDPVVKSSESQLHLPYLHACIKEGLRMWPPLTGLLGKLTPREGVTWNGVYLPPDIEICWNPMSMQRRTEIYGPDADYYRPERWLEATTAAASPPLSPPTSPTITTHFDTTTDVKTPASTLAITSKPSSIATDTNSTLNLTKMTQTLDLIFGHGKYGCLGKTVAQIELDKIFVALFDNFEFALVNPLQPMKSVSHGVHVQTDLWVRVCERKK